MCCPVAAATAHPVERLQVLCDRFQAEHDLLLGQLLLQQGVARSQLPSPTASTHLVFSCCSSPLFLPGLPHKAGSALPTPGPEHSEDCNFDLNSLSRSMSFGLTAPPGLTLQPDLLSDTTPKEIASRADNMLGRASCGAVPMMDGQRRRKRRGHHKHRNFAESLVAMQGLDTANMLRINGLNSLGCDGVKAFVAYVEANYGPVERCVGVVEFSEKFADRPSGHAFLAMARSEDVWRVLAKEDHIFDNGGVVNVRGFSVSL